MKRHTLPKTFLFWGHDMDIFLWYFLYTEWQDAIEYDIENIFSMPWRDLKRKDKIFKKKRFPKFYAKSRAYIKYYAYFGRKPDQSFRSFFRKKNISKESFDAYLAHISRPPYNCDPKELAYREEDFERYYRDSYVWTSEEVPDAHREKLALCKAIFWCWNDASKRRCDRHYGRV